MGLVEVTVTKMVPGTGGWYWWRLNTDSKWEIVLVANPCNGWPATVSRNTHAVPVLEMGGEWGPEVKISEFPKN